MTNKVYILHIEEYLSPDWSEWFEGLALTPAAAGGTQISGFIPDQSKLHGLLARIRDLNLTLISINPAKNEGLNEAMVAENHSNTKKEKLR